MNEVVEQCRSLFWQFFEGEIPPEDFHSRVDALEDAQGRLFGLTPRTPHLRVRRPLTRFSPGRSSRKRGSLRRPA